MTVIAGLLLLIALVCWTCGVLRFVRWVIARVDGTHARELASTQMVADAIALLPLDHPIRVGMISPQCVPGYCQCRHTCIAMMMQPSMEVVRS